MIQVVADGRGHQDQDVHLRKLLLDRREDLVGEEGLAGGGAMTQGDEAPPALAWWWRTRLSLGWRVGTHLFIDKLEGQCFLRC